MTILKIASIGLVTVAFALWLLDRWFRLDDRDGYDSEFDCFMD